ncbi:RES family NAD+ phosphorylase [Streptomyces sp. NPDC008001]|uniref:RES family NAD+ phosphorylase n=1 Tax=Streptomyces sp. NPDC008001 TaxID=3364804 RepID=UPI0036E6268D
MKTSRRLVDLNEPANNGRMSITGALIEETTKGYPLSHEFARQAYTAHFKGVRWKSLRDPGQGRNCALFSDTSGPDPERIFNPPKTQDIPDGLVKAVEAIIQRSQLRPANEYPL